jgi:hypothetical protein
MNIYIKSFNRPFYLDRCIQSVLFNVRNYDNIIILDDGTLSKYVTKLQRKYPFVQWRFSGADDNKFELLRQEGFDEIKKKYPDPSQFWVRELQKEKEEYFLLLEDDVWIVQNIDLQLLKSNMAENSCVFLKFWYPPQEKNIELTTQYSTPQNHQIQYYTTNINTLHDIYAVWIVAFAIYKKEYWINNFRMVKRMGDEQTQLIEAQRYVSNHPEATFAKYDKRVIYQGWAIPGRATPEYYDKGLIQHLFMDALNDAWFNDTFDITEGYPYDFSDEYLKKIMSDYLPNTAIELWQKWKNSDIIYAYD